MLKLIIEYSDGSTQEFTPPNFGNKPMIIIDPTNSLTVVRIQVEFYANVEYTGTATGWQMTGMFFWSIIDTTNGQTTDSAMVPFDVSATTPPPQSTPFVVTSSTVQSSDVEALYTSWVHNRDYQLRFSVAATAFYINFADGQRLSKTGATATALWNFKYNAPNTFTSISVSWNVVPQY